MLCPVPKTSFLPSDSIKTPKRAPQHKGTTTNQRTFATYGRLRRIPPNSMPHIGSSKPQNYSTVGTGPALQKLLKKLMENQQKSMRYSLLLLQIIPSKLRNDSIYHFNHSKIIKKFTKIDFFIYIPTFFLFSHQRHTPFDLILTGVIIIFEMMRSDIQQQLFRALSNRTRTKPNDIYAKMSSQISTLQDQVLLFNQLESQVPLWLRKETNKMGGEPKSLSLKLMTQPKYENLLVDCQLPQGDQQNMKNSKLFRKFSQRANKDPRNSSYGSTSKSFKAMMSRSKAQSGTQRLFVGKTESRVKESTMIQTLNQDSISFPNRSSALHEKNQAINKDFNISVTESIIFPFAEKPKAGTIELSRSKPMTLREQIIKKQQLLWNQWEKTEKYHQKIGQWMGESEAEKMIHTMCPNSRLVGVIQKIRSSRPQTCRVDDMKKRKRIKSEQL